MRFNRCAVCGDSASNRGRYGGSQGRFLRDTIHRGHRQRELTLMYISRRLCVYSSTTSHAALAFSRRRPNVVRLGAKRRFSLVLFFILNRCQVDLWARGKVDEIAAQQQLLVGVWGLIFSREKSNSCKRWPFLAWPLFQGLRTRHVAVSFCFCDRKRTRHCWLFPPHECFGACDRARF